MDNPYEPPQIAQCRGCSDSGCPHKPKPVWWHEAAIGLSISVGISLMLAATCLVLHFLGLPKNP